MLVKLEFYLKYCLDKDQEAMLFKNENNDQVTIFRFDFLLPLENNSSYFLEKLKQVKKNIKILLLENIN